MQRIFHVFALVSAALPTLIAAQQPVAQPPAPQLAEPTDRQERALIALSKQKWLWMADKNIAALDGLFEAQSIFVHMSRTMTKPEELEVIRSGMIQYQKAIIYEISARVMGPTAIVASRIDLHALVGGNVAINPFSVTETYVKKGGKWKLAALAFSKRSAPN